VPGSRRGGQTDGSASEGSTYAIGALPSSPSAAVASDGGRRLRLRRAARAPALVPATLAGGGRAPATRTSRPSPVTARRGRRPTCPRVVVCPGGGYHALMLTYEGHDISALAGGPRHGGDRAQVPKGSPDTRQGIHRGTGAAPCGSRVAKRDGVGDRPKPDRDGSAFSAGGHRRLAWAPGPTRATRKSPDPVERVDGRPDFLLLVYPSTEARRGTPTDQLVTKRTPPTFLVHARTDRLAVAESERFYAALKCTAWPPSSSSCRPASTGSAAARASCGAVAGEVHRLAEVAQAGEVAARRATPNRRGRRNRW